MESLLLKKVENLRKFHKLVSNPNAIAIFLSVAKHGRRTFNDLENDTKLDKANLHIWIGELMKGNFIKTNPHKDSFKLAFEGQLFAEKLKIDSLEVRKFLGEKCLIEPLKIK